MAKNLILPVIEIKNFNSQLDKVLLLAASTSMKGKRKT